MGLAASIATGLALAGRMHAVAVDGDGSLLMNPGSLVIAGMTADLPLVHVLLDDGAYASTGGQATPSARADFVAWAKACGYSSAARTDDPPAFAVPLRRALITFAPSFIHCVLTDQDERVPPRIDLELAGHFRRFSGHVATL
jgi:sulfopyruvate decarboxylase subunit beta